MGKTETELLAEVEKSECGVVYVFSGQIRRLKAAKKLVAEGKLVPKGQHPVGSYQTKREMEYRFQLTGHPFQL